MSHTTIDSIPVPAQAIAITPEERARRLRGRNLATLAGLFGLALLFYAVTVVRVGGL